MARTKKKAARAKPTIKPDEVVADISTQEAEDNNKTVPQDTDSTEGEETGDAVNMDKATATQPIATTNEAEKGAYGADKIDAGVVVSTDKESDTPPKETKIAVDKNVEKNVSNEPKVSVPVGDNDKAKAKAPTVVSREDRLNKLHQLRMRKNEASKLNKKEVVEEDRISKLPKNWELKKRRVEWDMETDKAKKDAETRGQDYDRTKYLHMSVKEVEAHQEKREKKEQLMNKGFGDYITAGTQSYQRNVSNIRVDKEEYQARREIAGDNFYVGVNDLTVGALGDGRVDNVDRMVNDLEKRIEKRQKMSRRRAFDEDGDINYINERNMRFNQKAERYYGKHTQEIKDSLERGTAL